MGLRTLSRTLQGAKSRIWIYLLLVGLFYIAPYTFRHGFEIPVFFLIPRLIRFSVRQISNSMKWTVLLCGKTGAIKDGTTGVCQLHLDPLFAEVNATVQG